ncbi:MAG: hypothetical protein NC086_10610 [Alistipes sp.]|nr:hypothetical protein [Alistipes sp.]
MKRLKLLLLILSLTLICGGCAAEHAEDRIKKETESSNVETESNNPTTEAEPATEKLEMDIDITDFYQTDQTYVTNHYYIDENNVLWGSGSNDSGQLGLEEINYDVHEEPVKIAENVIHFDYSQYGLLIYITDDHRLYGLGEASYGIFPEIYRYKDKQGLLDGFAQVTSPVLLMEDVVYAVCGRNDIAMLKSNSEVWIQGLIWYEAYEEYEYIPEPEKVLDHAELITGGFFNHAALLADGTVWTWGYNYSGNCGIEGKAVISKPEKAAEDVVMVWTDYNRLDGLTGISQFEDNTVIRKSDGSYWICGVNVGDEKKVLPRYYEVSDWECFCSSEFLKYSP